MEKVAIVTDSIACVPEDMMEELRISWVPYYIHRGKEVLRDLVTITSEEFYKWLPTAKELPTTANPSTGEYLTMYEELVKKGFKHIVSIHGTSISTGAYQAAMGAKNILKDLVPDINLEIIDTMNIAMCHGWMTIEAARDAMIGKPMDQIIERIRNMIPVTKLLQTAETLKYLEMGGRIGKAKHLMGSLLSIKPLIGMEEGVIVPLGQARTTKRIYNLIVEKVEEAIGVDQKIKVAYLHAAALDEVEKLRVLVESKLDVVESLVTDLCPALGVHTGPGTTGICYYPVD